MYFADCPPPHSKLVVLGSSAITVPTVAVRSLEGEQWVVRHAETKSSIVASVQSGACSLSYSTSSVHLRLCAVWPDGSEVVDFDYLWFLINNLSHHTNLHSNFSHSHSMICLFPHTILSSTVQINEYSYYDNTGGWSHSIPIRLRCSVLNWLVQLWRIGSWRLLINYRMFSQDTSHLHKLTCKEPL